MRVALVTGQLLFVLLTLERLDMLPPLLRLVLALCVGAWWVREALGAVHFRSIHAGVSLVAVAMVLGIDLTRDGVPWNAGTATFRLILMLGAVAMVVGIVRSTLTFWGRVSALLVVALVLALLRGGVPLLAGHEIVLVILASMLMFRTMVYLYDASTSASPQSWRTAFAYLMTAPNALVPNFPIVDHRTFAGVKPPVAPDVAQRAAHRIVTGMTHLFVLRLVEQIHVSSDAVYSGKTLSVYLLTNLLTYLRISGSFHIATGSLLLLGFDLPRTHVRYLLASGFSDYWRRANTYWRAFLLKLFFYPMVFRLKRIGHLRASLASVAWIFFLSWAFHVYQTWWIWGHLHVTMPDALFWVVLGTLVGANTWWLFVRPPSQTAPDRARLLPVMLATCGTFATICVAWSLMLSPSLEAWFRLWSHADRFTALAAVGVLGLVGVAKWVLEFSPLARKQEDSSRPLATVLPVVAMFLVTLLPEGARSREFGLGALDPVLSSRRIVDALEDGDSLAEPPLATFVIDDGWRQLTEALTLRPIQPTLREPLPLRAVSDYRLHALPPALNSEPQFEATSFSTNMNGDRDAAPRAGGTPHAVFLGGSAVMGWGIDDGNTFADHIDRLFGDRLDVTNLGVHGYSVLSQVSVLKERGQPLDPDLVVVFGDVIDFRMSSFSLHETLRRTGSVPDTALAGILERARVEPRTRPRLAEKRLEPYQRDILAWSLRAIVETSRQLDATPIFVTLPTVSRLSVDLDEEARVRELNGLAAAAGMRVVDLSALGGESRLDGLVSGRVPFLTARAHTDIAEALAPVLRPLVER